MRFNLKILLVLSFAFLTTFSFAQKKKKKKKKESEAIELGYKESRQAEGHFLTGMKYYMLEEYEKAMTYFQKSYAIHPNSAGTNFQIAQLYMGSGYPKEALPYCEKALLLNDSNIYYYQLLANCYSTLAEATTNGKQKKECQKKAAQTYEALVKKYPSQDDVYFDLANLYLQQGEVSEGLKAINKIEKKYGVNEEISMQKQQIYLHINQFDNAVKEAEKLIESFPGNSAYTVNLAKLYFSNGKAEEAKNVLEKADTESTLDGEGKVLLSDVYWSLKEKEKANKLLLDAFSDPNYSYDQKVNIMVGFINSQGVRLTASEMEKGCQSIEQLHPEQAKSYIVYGDFLLKENRKKEGRDKYLQGLAIDESFFQVWQNVVILDAELEEDDSIIVHTEKALEIFPNQGFFWYYNASSYLVKKEYKKAIYAFEKAEKLVGDNIALQLVIKAQMGDTYNSLKNYEKSDKYYQDVLLVDPNNVHVLNNYSYFLSLRNEKLEEANIMCEKLLGLEPENSTYLDTYAWVLYKQKKYQEAKELLIKALTTSSDGTIIEHYGDVLYQLGDKEGAVAQWQKSKETGDFSELLEKKLTDKKLYE